MSRIYCRIMSFAIVSLNDPIYKPLKLNQVSQKPKQVPRAGANKMYDESDVELAENYLDTLEGIKKLQEEQNFNESDVELAEKYLDALERIKKLEEEQR